jgi:hypothetical protein
MAERPSKLDALQRGVCLVLTVVWVGAGGAKLLAVPTFQGVLEAHGVLSDAAIAWAWVVPAVEVVLGALIFVVGAKAAYPRLRRVAAVGSAALLAAFCVYIAQVPEDVFKSVGCGCEGALGLTDFTGSPSRAVAIGVDVVLGLGSVAVWRAGK